jgi:hypothetical protein
MSEIPLASARASADKHILALKNLLQRYQATNSPVNYKEAAFDGISATACSSVLGYLSGIGLIEKVQSGEYTPTDSVIQYFNDDFNPSSAAATEIQEILNDYEIYNEANFVLTHGDHEGRELASKVVEIEEELSEEDLGDVTRSIEFINELNMLDSSDSETLAKETTKSKSQSKSDQEITDATNDRELATEFVAKDLPRYGDPEKLINIIKVMETGGSWTSDEIEEADALKLDKRNINGTLDYGEKLEFIDEAEDGYNPTSDGFELYYNRDQEAEVASLFKNAVKRYPPYQNILIDLVKKSGSFEERGIIENKDFINVLRTRYGFTEISSASLKRSIHTIFKTLEYMQYGEQKKASGSLPSRFTFSENVDLTDIVSDILPDAKGSPSTDEKRSGNEQEEDKLAIAEERKCESPNISETTEQEGMKVDGGSRGNKKINNKEQEISVNDGTIERKSNHSKQTNIDISVTLDLSELDSAELEAKLDILDEYL